MRSGEQPKARQARGKYRDIMICAKSLTGTLGSFSMKFQGIRVLVHALENACCMVVCKCKFSDCILHTLL